MSDKIGVAPETHHSESGSFDVTEKAFEATATPSESGRVDNLAENSSKDVVPEASRSTPKGFDVISNGVAVEAKNYKSSEKKSKLWKLDDSETWGHDLEVFEEKIQQ